MIRYWNPLVNNKFSLSIECVVWGISAGLRRSWNFKSLIICWSWSQVTIFPIFEIWPFWEMEWTDISVLLNILQSKISSIHKVNPLFMVNRYIFTRVLQKNNVHQCPEKNIEIITKKLVSRSVWMSTDSKAKFSRVSFFLPDHWQEKSKYLLEKLWLSF